MVQRKRSALSLAAMEKIIRDAGASRVSDSAKKSLEAVLLRYAEKICKKATDAARHAKRTTVTDKDIELAAKD